MTPAARHMQESSTCHISQLQPGHGSVASRPHSIHVAHTAAFTHRRFYIQSLLYRITFTQAHFYTQTASPFTQRRFYIPTLLQRNPFTHLLGTYRNVFRNHFAHNPFYAPILLHTETFAHKPFYTQTRLHANAFTHRFFTRPTL